MLELSDTALKLTHPGCRAPRETFWDIRVTKMYSEARRPACCLSFLLATIRGKVVSGLVWVSSDP